MGGHERGPYCDTSESSCYGQHGRILGRDLEEHITDLEDNDGEKVFVRCKTEVDI